MPDTSWDDAIREAYATNPTDEVYLDTVELAHPLVTPSIYLVRDRRDWDLDLEDSGGTKTFRSCGFRLQMPASGQDGLQDLTLAIDNVADDDGASPVTDFINTVKGSQDEVTVTFRAYLADDVTGPQNDPPLTLVLKDIEVLPDGTAQGRASFADIINKPFLPRLYTRADFPGLGN